MILLHPSNFRKNFHMLDLAFVAEVSQLMTPNRILTSSVFDAEPEVITPATIPDADTLLRRRNDVRDLKLLPVKNHEIHELYNSQRDDPKLVDEIKGYLDGEPMVLAPNKFPYRLPPGIEQYLVWIDTSFDYLDVEGFIACCLKYFNVTPNELILFERSLTTTAKLVKGTFRSVRHIHFWIKVS